MKMEIKLSYKIIASILTVSVLAVAIISFGTTQIMTSSLQDEISDKLATKSIEQMDKLALFVSARSIDLKEFASEKSFEEGTIIEKVNRLKEIEEKSKFYNHIDLYSPTGVKIADSNGFRNSVNIPNDPDITHERFHENNADQLPFLHTPFHGGFYSDPRPSRDKEHNSIVLRFSGPVYDENENLEGILVTSVNIETLNNIINAEVKSPNHKDSKIDLIGREGILLFSNYQNDQVLDKNLKGLSIYPTIRKSPRNVETLISNEEGTEYLYVAVEDVGFEGDNPKGWIMISKIPTEEVFAPIDRAVENGINAAIIIITISIPLSILMTWPITRRIKKLTDIVDNISKGETDVNIDDDLKNSKDEIGKLARSFDRTLTSNERIRQEKGLIHFSFQFMKLETGITFSLD